MSNLASGLEQYPQAYWRTARLARTSREFRLAFGFGISQKHTAWACLTDNHGCSTLSLSTTLRDSLEPLLSSAGSAAGRAAVTRLARTRKSAKHCGFWSI